MFSLESTEIDGVEYPSVRVDSSNVVVFGYGPHAAISLHLPVPVVEPSTVEPSTVEPSTVDGSTTQGAGDLAPGGVGSVSA